MKLAITGNGFADKTTASSLLESIFMNCGNGNNVITVNVAPHISLTVNPSFAPERISLPLPPPLFPSDSLLLLSLLHKHKTKTNHR